MPAIAKIRFTNVVFENGSKRYNDEVFDFDGHNGAMLLENGGGKTVFIQTALQAIIPHIDMAERKIKDTLSLENAPAHIAIEWILNDQPRRYAITATSLYIENNQLNSLKYVYDYAAGDAHDILNLPFSVEQDSGAKRPATRGEISDYYQRMSKQSMNAKVFTTIQDYGKYIENTYKIIPSEWRKVAVINSGEGNVDEFFNKCKTTEQLLNNLLIPVVEEAIEGDNKAKFVETFERQREHFKKNRVLQDKIEQSRLVKEQIDSYVGVYEQYEDERVALLDVKREAKTIANYVTNQIENKSSELRFNEANAMVLTRDDHTYNQKVLSFEWLLKTEELSGLQEAYKLLAERLVDKQTVYDQYATRKQNIELSVLSRDVKVSKEQLNIVNETLNHLEENIDISDVKLKLQENAKWIKGHYAYELEQRHIAKEELQAKLIVQDDVYTKVKDDYESAIKYEKEVISNKSHLSAKVELLGEEVDGLYAELFEDEEIKSPSILLSKIEEKMDQLNKKQLDSEREKLELLGQVESLKMSIDSNEKNSSMTKSHLEVSKRELEDLNHAKNEVEKELEARGYHLYLTGDFYNKQTSLLSELEEQRELTYHKKEKALLLERELFRQVDTYGTLSHYYSEPMIEPLVHELSEKTSFVTSGSEHLSSVKDAMAMDEDALFERYPYWGLTIVTSVNDEQLVRDYVGNHVSELTQMIIVTTIERLDKRLKNVQGSDHNQLADAIYPESWKTNLSNTAFTNWRENLKMMAQKQIELRKEIETEFLLCDRQLRLTRDYYNNYSFETYRNLTAKVTDFEKNFEENQSTLEKLKTDLNVAVSQLDKAYSRIEASKLSTQELQVVLKRAGDLKEKDQRLMNLDRELQMSETKYLEATRHIEALTRRLEETIEKRDMILEKESQYDREVTRILDLELYNEVEDFEAISSNTSIEALKEERLQLDKKLFGLKADSGDVESRKSQLEALHKRYTNDYNQKVKEATYEVEITKVFYEGEVDKLYETIVEINLEIKTLTKELRVSEKAITELSTRCNILKEKCDIDYQGLFKFDVETSFIKNKLKIEKATLSDRERKIKREKQKIIDFINHLRKTEQELLIKDGAFDFLVDYVEAMTFDLKYYEAFDESPEAMVSKLLSRLEGQHKVTKKAYVAVQEKQEQVMDYCKEVIQDHRLRDTVVKGIYHKDDYNELIVYQEKMTEIIMKIIQVAEDDKRESDIELQTFLSHLLTYTQNVSSELGMIQNKTIIEVEGVLKQIFVFDIPEWESDEAKLNLRAYIDETIEYYEKESLSEEVDEAILRKHVEERLGVKNLLQVVMGEQTIKIKCRKVTNDMKINKAPMVWESTNKWSGGEKWSKNMTLFLSILNYLAEKKQHLSPNQKKQRSVILDNPFGKASSDHVLKPVFMIAEKLGFQIIALTAHAEGKFISEYFPVVYSLRLRHTKDHSKQLMTNERTLNYTYLKEHSPMTIMRMQEVEQLNLFGE